MSSGCIAGTGYASRYRLEVETDLEPGSQRFRTSIGLLVKVGRIFVKLGGSYNGQNSEFLSKEFICVSIYPKLIVMKSKGNFTSSGGVPRDIARQQYY